MFDTITVPRVVVEQALEAIELHLSHHENGCVFLSDIPDALRAALEQPQVEQSSVVGVIGWKNHLPNSGTVVHWTALMPPLGTKLYIHPQHKRQPLTDEEITELADAHMEAFAQFVGAGEVWFEGEKEFARAIERAHGIGDEK